MVTIEIIIDSMPQRIQIKNATYIPHVGEALGLTPQQQEIIKKFLLKTPELKKRFMSFVNHWGSIPLKKEEYLNLTPAEIRKNIKDPNVKWFINLPSTLKILRKRIYLEDFHTLVIIDCEFKDYYQQVLKDIAVECEEALITVIDQINSGEIPFEPK